MRRLTLTAIVLSLLVGAAAADPGQDVRIATFNIQVFGPAKVNRPAIRAYLAEVVRKFDIVAIQEVKDASQTVPGAFLAEINKGGRRYLYVLSERTGKQPDDQAGQEQYAIYFDSDAIEAVDQGALFEDAPRDLFQREPFTARFRVKGTRLNWSPIGSSPPVGHPSMRAFSQAPLGEPDPLSGRRGRLEQRD